MTIIVDEGFIAMWHFMPSADIDFIGGLSRGEPSPQPIDMDRKQKMKLVYRFRYYKDDLVFHSEDEKHWYELTIIDRTPREALDATRDIVHKIAGAMDSKVTEIVVDERGPQGVVDRMQKLPFMHTTIAKENEA